MIDKDIIELLTDIWEEDAEFNRLRVVYVEHRKNNLIDIQKFIKFGLNQHIFEIFQCVSKDGHFPIDDFEKLQIDDALKIVDNQSSWKQDKVFYEVAFVDNEIWFNDLINYKRIPEIFIDYESDLK